MTKKKRKWKKRSNSVFPCREFQVFLGIVNRDELARGHCTITWESSFSHSGKIFLGVSPSFSSASFLFLPIPGPRFFSLFYCQAFLNYQSLIRYLAQLPRHYRAKITLRCTWRLAGIASSKRLVRARNKTRLRIFHFQSIHYYFLTRCCDVTNGREKGLSLNL